MIGRGLFGWRAKRAPRAEPVASAAASPRAAAAALRSTAMRAANRVLMNYDAATQPRTSRFRARAGSADEVARDYRARLSLISRDMVRNSPLGAAAVRVISGEIVGTGIRPAFSGLDDRLLREAGRLISSHLDTAAIDADGRLNFAGIQRLAARATVGDGECFVRRVRRASANGRPLALPFQIQLLEAEHLDLMKSARPGASGSITEGIERDPDGQVVAYHMFRDHPGGGWLGRIMRQSERIPAADVIHIFRMDRPGQGRGVSWFAPAALRMQDLTDAIGANVTRQKIAACFAAFVTSPDEGEGRPMSSDGAGKDELSLEPGTVQDLLPGEKIEFATPPSVDGFDGFARLVYREVAAALGITYEALVGDLGEVNFSSAKVGRMAMYRNVDDWRADMMVPTLCGGVARWFLEAWALITPRDRAEILAALVSHTPPARIPIEPLKEAKAAEAEVRAGFRSRSDVVRSLGRDPAAVGREIEADNAADKAAGALFTTTTAAPVAPVAA